jgi:hypothetical protein
MNADRWHGVRGLGRIGDSGQLTGQGSATLGSSQSPAPRYSGGLPALFEYFGCRQAWGGSTPGQWVDDGARRPIDRAALAARDPTRSPACKCSLRSADREVPGRCGTRAMQIIEADRVPE